jgi:hypothetical protein
MTRNAIIKGEFPIEVLVETATSRENVQRVAQKMGCQVDIEGLADEFRLTLSKQPA